MIDMKTNSQDMNLNAVETDTIGEILNISMGAAATAVSIMLNRTVSITTPSVKVIRVGDFEYKELEPAIGVEIEYVKGLHGSNIMIMSVRDVKKIVGLLLSEGSGELKDDAGELNEIHISALGEVMNQMMGSSCTALASFLNTSINISTPKPLEVSYINERLSKLNSGDYIVSVRFRWQVEELLDSEFITILPIEFTKQLVKNAAADSENDQPVKEEATVTGHVQVPETVYAEENIGEKPAPTAKPVVEPPRAQKAKRVNVAPMQFAAFNQGSSEKGMPSQVDLGLVMGVELNVTVEIGRQKKPLREVLELREGGIIELDKQAGEPVDVMVNGQLIARGDVVVIDDNFGVRITEIVGKEDS